MELDGRSFYYWKEERDGDVLLDWTGIGDWIGMGLMVDGGGGGEVRTLYSVLLSSFTLWAGLCTILLFYFGFLVLAGLMS